ncbi:MAG: hypothetical protein WD557_02000 [Dehalococcoidia bacterium]
MKHAFVGAVALLAASLAVACETEDDQPTPSLTPEDLVAPVAIHDGTWNYDDALIEGTLVEEDGCLVLLAGDERVLVAFPDDRVTWDPPSHTLTVRGVEFRPGDPARFGGSGGGGQLSTGTEWVNAPPNTCRYDSIWFPQPPSEQPASGRPTPAPGGDAATYAEQFDVSLDEAERRMSLQPVAGEVMGKLESVHIDRLSGLWIEHGGEYRVVAWYTGGEGGLDEARAIAAAAPLSVEIRTGARLTRMDLVETMDRVVPRARDLFYLIGAYTDEQYGAVVLNIENRPPNAARADELAAQLSEEFGVHVVINVGR